MFIKGRVYTKLGKIHIGKPFNHIYNQVFSGTGTTAKLVNRPHESHKSLQPCISSFEVHNHTYAVVQRTNWTPEKYSETLSLLLPRYQCKHIIL